MAHTLEAYGRSCRSCVVGSPCKASACWEDQDCKENPAVAEEVASVAARGA